MLGTSCMVPTKERNPSTVLLRYGGKGFLFDCGEGTQKRMNEMSIKRTEVKYILISHFHGDHVGGLLPMLQTIGNEAENTTIELHGPKGLKERMEGAFKFIDFDVNMDLQLFEHDLESPKKIIETPDYYVECANLDHTVPCVGYSFVEKDKRRINKVYTDKLNIPDGPHLKKLTDGESITFEGKKVDFEEATFMVSGRKISYITDTTLCNNCIALSDCADLLICESSMHSKDEEKAVIAKHMTAKDAAFIANNANVEKLVLTHFSQRYKDVTELEEDAKDYFNNVVSARDSMRFNL